MEKRTFDEIVSLKTVERILRFKKEVSEREGCFFKRELLWAEAYQKNKQKSLPELKQAQALKYLLEKMTVEISQDELIVGRYPRRVPSAAEKKRFDIASNYLYYFCFKPQLLALIIFSAILEYPNLSRQLFSQERGQQRFLPPDR